MWFNLWSFPCIKYKKTFLRLALAPKLTLFDQKTPWETARITVFWTCAKESLTNLWVDINACGQETEEPALSHAREKIVCRRTYSTKIKSFSRHRKSIIHWKCMEIQYQKIRTYLFATNKNFFPIVCFFATCYMDFLCVRGATHMLSLWQQPFVLLVISPQLSVTCLVWDRPEKLFSPRREANME